MIWLSWSVLVVGVLAFSATATIWHLYMFQLNHYIHADHWRWMLRDPRNLRSVLMPLAGVLAGALIKSSPSGSKATDEGSDVNGRA